MLNTKKKTLKQADIDGKWIKTNTKVLFLGILEVGLNSDGNSYIKYTYFIPFDKTLLAI